MPRQQQQRQIDRQLAALLGGTETVAGKPAQPSPEPAPEQRGSQAGAQQRPQHRARSQRAPAYASDPLEKTRDSWLYAAQVDYAWLTTTPLTRANAQQMLVQAQALLHFSPEPRVVEKLIESAVMLGHDALALQVLDRYRAAFPLEYGRWAQRQTGVAPADN